MLDPNRVTIVREPMYGDDVCLITDLRSEGEVVQVRCEYRGDRVYGGQLTPDRDYGVFAELAADPFAEQSLIEMERTGYWSFDLVGRKDRNHGYLEAKLHNEGIDLVAGRFATGSGCGEPRI